MIWTQMTPCVDCIFDAGLKRPSLMTGRATVVLVAKRETKDKPTEDDCVTYRYGSFCAEIQVVGGFLVITDKQSSDQMSPN